MHQIVESDQNLMAQPLSKSIQQLFVTFIYRENGQNSKNNEAFQSPEFHCTKFLSRLFSDLSKKKKELKVGVYNVFEVN